MKQQTGVEWLEARLTLSLGDELKPLRGFFVIAKEMEKQQIMDAFEQGENNSVDYFNPENRIKESENYYIETFNTKEK